MLDADETAEFGTIGTEDFNTDMFNLAPESSSEFLSRVKIYHTKKGILKKGEILKISMKNSKMRSLTLEDVDASDHDSIPGLTKFILVKFHGSLGNSTLDETDVTTMDCNIGAMWFKEISWTYISPHIPLIAVTNTKPTSGAYEGPTEDDIKED
jgi:hypothetical protein